MVSSFRTTRRVAFADTDMAGITHFSSFFRYMEDAEHEFLRSLGLSVVMSDEEGAIGWPRVSAHCDYTRPIKFEDVVEIELRITKLGTKSISYEFRFTMDDQPIAVGQLTAVCCRLQEGQPPKSIPHIEKFRSQVEVAS